jgi:hypothetical protein
MSTVMGFLRLASETSSRSSLTALRWSADLIHLRMARNPITGTL